MLDALRQRQPYCNETYTDHGAAAYDSRLTTSTFGALTSASVPKPSITSSSGAVLGPSRSVAGRMFSKPIQKTDAKIEAAIRDATRRFAKYQMASSRAA